MTLRIERRVLPTEFEFRTKGDSLVIEGYAYRFHKRSQNLGGFVEQVLPGAGADAAQNDDIRALFNHDASKILGRNTSGTLRLAEDSEGLPYEITADIRQSYVQDLAIALERGDVNNSSFGFRAIETDWGLTEDEFPLRSIVKMGLFDVSPVTYPAYLSSSSGLGQRAIESFYESRGLSPDEVSLVDAIRGKAPDEPLPRYEFLNDDAIYAERHILLQRKDR
jgi:HK97 family phage prohead protease